MEHPRTLRGQINLPGDKSISHRYAILGAMASGVTRIHRFSQSRDCRSTLECLARLGVQVEHQSDRVQITSRGWRCFQSPRDPLDAGNSGTTLRLLSALLAASPFVSTIGGDSSLNRRPMRRIMAPLIQMGAQIEARQQEYPPLRIQGASLRGIRYRLPLASAQVKSCLLLAGLMAHGETRVEEPTPSRDHTERALPFFGAPFSSHRGQLRVRGPAPLQATSMEIPGDFSAAAFFLVAALLVPEARLQLKGVGLNPSRTALLALLEQAGFGIEKRHLRNANGEPLGDLHLHGSAAGLRGFPSEIRGKWIPNLIDEIPVLALLGTRLERGLAIREAAELRKKESDRIHALVHNFRNLGIPVEEFPDGLYIPPGQRLLGGRVETFGDHRIAMAFAIGGLIAQGPIEIDNRDCVSVSFPGFFEALASVTAET